MFLKSTRLAGKSLLKCACNNCKNLDYCFTEFSCYKAEDDHNCLPDGNCFGCFNNIIQTLQCNITTSNLNISCCSSYDMCNLRVKKLSHQQDLPDSNESYVYIISSMGTILIIFLVIIIFFIYCRGYKSRSKSQDNDSMSNLKQQLKYSSVILKKAHNTKCSNTIQINNNILDEKNRNILKQEDNSIVSFTTTGCGTDELIQRTIARDIHFDLVRGVIGQGRYGSVWCAKWNGDQVAVKVFLSMHEHSWARETEIYQTCMLRHENILGYIASDIKGNGYSVNMLLITEYHPIGSLYDYLQTHTIDRKFLIVKFLYTISNGLNHLHQEIFGTKYKPVIVHRDLKTKNILIKNNLDCCIGDFGLSVRYNSQTNQMEHEANSKSLVKIREGSVRYMPPECLNETLNMDSIDDLKRTDIYSFSLIIWEVLSRFKFNSSQEVNEHKPPFHEFVSGDPTFELMKDVVCVRKIRPTLRLEEANLGDQELVTIMEIMKECWKELSCARLSSLNIKKKLNKIYLSLADA